MDHWGTAKKTVINLFLLCFRLSALTSTTQAQSSANLNDPPSPIQQDVRTTITVLAVVGILVFCAVSGMLVYCICQPWKRRTVPTQLSDV